MCISSCGLIFQDLQRLFRFCCFTFSWYISRHSHFLSTSFELIIVVPDRRGIQHVDVLVVTCVDGWGIRGMFGARQGTERGCKMGQLIQSMGPAWVEVHILLQRATSPSKMPLITFSNTIFYHICIFIIVCAIS